MLAYALEVAADQIATFVGGKAGLLGEGERLPEPKGEGEDSMNGVVKADDEPPKGADADGDVVMKTEEEGEEGPDEEGSAPEPTSPAAPSPLAPPEPSSPSANTSSAPPPAADAAGEESEDPMLKRLRLNLLALAKRAPLDQIMKLPPELVPAHLRHIVPTADT